MYRDLSYSTKSMTLAFTDTGSQKKKKFFQKWNRTPKDSLNFGSARVYLFVSTLENPKEFQTLHGMYRVLSYSTKSMTLAFIDTGYLKNFQNRAPKGSSNFGNVRVYLFVGTHVTIVYIHMRTPRVSDSTWDV